jgi:hypothetical protein
MKSNLIPSHVSELLMVREMVAKTSVTLLLGDNCPRKADGSIDRDACKDAPHYSLAHFAHYIFCAGYVSDEVALRMASNWQVQAFMGNGSCAWHEFARELNKPCACAVCEGVRVFTGDKFFAPDGKRIVCEQVGRVRR